MTDTLRERIALAELAAITGLDGLPTPVRDVEQPDTADYVPLAAGSPDGHFLALLQEADPVRREDPPTLGDGRATWEWNYTLVAAYAVRSDDPEVRRARREAAVAAITAAVMPDGFMGDLGGLVNAAWVEPYERRDDVYDGNVPLAVARIPIVAWFSAADPNA